jgi:putative phosphoesterase
MKRTSPIAARKGPGARKLTGRVGVLGDVHCEDLEVAAALSLFALEQVEAVLCVGDVVDGPGDVARTVELLRAAGVEAVGGNHERWWASNTLRDLPDATPSNALAASLRDWLRALPPQREYATPLGSMLLCHGMPGDDMATLGVDDSGYGLANNTPVQKLLSEPQYDVVLSGHSHRRMVRELGGVTFINAGTLFREHEPCVAVLDFEKGEVRFFDWRAGEWLAALAVKLPR